MLHLFNVVSQSDNSPALKSVFHDNFGRWVNCILQHDRDCQNVRSKDMGTNMTQQISRNSNALNRKFKIPQSATTSAPKFQCLDEGDCPNTRSRAFTTCSYTKHQMICGIFRRSASQVITKGSGTNVITAFKIINITAAHKLRTGEQRKGIQAEALMPEEQFEVCSNAVRTIGRFPCSLCGRPNKMPAPSCGACNYFTTSSRSNTFGICCCHNFVCICRKLSSHLKLILFLLLLLFFL